MFKVFFNYLLPLGVATAIVFFILPNMGGNLEVLVEKTAIEWGMPLLVVRIIFTSLLGLILLVVTGIAVKVAVWLAVVILVVAIFAPAALGNLPIVGTDVKEYVQQKIVEVEKNAKEINIFNNK